MIISILIGIYMGLYNVSIALFFCFEILILIGIIKFRKSKLIICLLLILVSFSYARICKSNYDKAFNISENYYIAKVIRSSEDNSYLKKYILEIKSGKYKNYKILAYVKDNLDYGDIIKFSHEIEKPDGPRNDKGFDYARYLRENKVSGIAKLEDVEKISKEKDFKFYIFEFKKKIISKLDKNYNKETAGFLKAILIGETSSLDENIKENFKISSVSHILAISGMHVSYIVLAIDKLLEKIIKNIKARYGLIILFLAFFTILVGESVSVLRSCIMTSIVFLGKIILRKDNFYSGFKLALLILVLMNPYTIFSGSMWLSFGGSIGIVLYARLIEKKAIKVINRVCKKEFFRKIFCKIATIFSVTAGAQIVVFPIMIYVFNTFSLNFFVSNILISELVGPILILGYLSIIFPFLSVFENILVKIIIGITQVISKFPLNQILIPTPKLYKIIFYYIILGIIAFLYTKRKIWLTRSFRKKGKMKICLVSILIGILIFGNFSLLFMNDFEIHFLDVGQGDSCLIKLPDKKIIFIDGGSGNKDEYDYGEKVLAPYLLDHGITKIDYVIVSHFDLDHCGGLFYIIKNFKVNNIIIGKQYSEYTNLLEFLEVQKERKINLIVLEAGNILSLEKNTKLEVLFPDIHNKISENEINNNSLVFKIYYNTISILFTGDIEEEAEKVLVNLYKDKLKSDILKVAHHGSKTSSTEEFIRLVAPKISLIGVGKNNNFGHPSTEVVERLESYRK